MELTKLRLEDADPHALRMYFYRFIISILAL
jgi:hypothetical protein